MSLSYVKCFNDETENWENIPILAWASDFCFGFFNALNTFPPYVIARKFSSNLNFAHDVLLGNNTIQWEHFKLSKYDYNEIKKYFMTHFKCHFFELKTQINSSNDYIMWRREKKYGIPIHAQEEFYKRFNAAEIKLKSLENTSDGYLPAWNALNELIKEDQYLINLYKI